MTVIVRRLPQLYAAVHRTVRRRRRRVYSGEGVLDILRPYKTCFSFWKRAQDIFANDIQRLFNATQRVASLKQINHDMVSHIGKARAAVEELKSFYVADSLEVLHGLNSEEPTLDF